MISEVVAERRMPPCRCCLESRADDRRPLSLRGNRNGRGLGAGRALKGMPPMARRPSPGPPRCAGTSASPTGSIKSKSHSRCRRRARWNISIFRSSCRSLPRIGGSRPSRRAGQ